MQSIRFIRRESISLGMVLNIASERSDVKYIFHYCDRLQRLKTNPRIRNIIENISYNFDEPIDFDMSEEALTFRYFDKIAKKNNKKLILETDNLGYKLIFSPNFNRDTTECGSNSKLVLTSEKSIAFNVLSKLIYFRSAEYYSPKSINLIRAKIINENRDVYFLNSGLGLHEFNLYKELRCEFPSKIRIIGNGVGRTGIYQSRDILGTELIKVNVKNEKKIKNNFNLTIPMYFNREHYHPYNIGGSPDKTKLRRLYGDESILILDKPVFNKEIEKFIVHEYGYKYSDEFWLSCMATLISEQKKNGRIIVVKPHPFSELTCQERFSNVIFLNRNLNTRKLYQVSSEVHGWGSRELLYSSHYQCPSYSYITNAHVPNSILGNNRTVIREKVISHIQTLLDEYYLGMPINFNIKKIDNFQRTTEIAK